MFRRRILCLILTDEKFWDWKPAANAVHFGDSMASPVVSGGVQVSIAGMWTSTRTTIARPSLIAIRVKTRGLLEREQKNRLRPFLGPFLSRNTRALLRRLGSRTLEVAS